MAGKVFHFVINQQTSSFVSDSGRGQEKHIKCLQLFTEMKLYLVCMSLKGFKDAYRDKRSLKMIQGVGNC